MFDGYQDNSDRIPLSDHAHIVSTISLNTGATDGHQAGGSGDVDGSSQHCHGPSGDSGVDKVARRKLIIASILCLVFMVGEATGGGIAHSLAIMTDAAHLLTDFASFMISLFAIFLASRPATKKMSFGWHRAEVVGALVSVLMIWVVTGILVYLAIMRVVNGEYEIDGKVMLITSGIGVGVNILMAFTLHQHSHSHGGGGHGHSHGGGGSSHGHSHSDNSHGHSDNDNSHGHSHSTNDGGHGHSHSNGGDGHGHSHSNGGDGHGHSHGESVVSSASATSLTSPAHDARSIEEGQDGRKQMPRENINVRAAFIHVIGDFLQSIGVFVAAIVIYVKPEYKIADPICTFVFSVLVLFTTISILRDTMNVLMEGTPRGLDFNEVKKSLYEVKGVIEVHNLRIWSLTMNKIAVSVHLAVDPAENAQTILKQSSRLLRHRFDVHDVTIQMEEYVAEMADCQQCQDPKD